VKGPDRILVGVDFSERSRVALGFAGRLACQFNAELHVAHALDPLLAGAAEHHGLPLGGETEHELREFTASTWPGSTCNAHFHVVTGQAPTAIVHTAEHEGADVIVLAAHGMSGAQHLLLGSTTEGVLRTSSLSVLVVPDEWTPVHADAADLRGEGPVVAAVDFRIPSIEAAADGVTLARALHAELVLVHVVPALRVLPRWREHADAALAAQASEAQLELVRLRDAICSDVLTELLVTTGRVSSCLAESVKRFPRAIVVVGRTVHPHGFAPPGTTAYRVLTHSHVPVLMHVAR
jgi:nucleotide-binding universal stress UspA family protein